MASYIELSQGREAIVDDDDFEELNRFKWYFWRGYAVRNVWGKHRATKRLWMHRIVAKSGIGEECDHINRNRLDNRKANLRNCSRAENMRNRGATRQNGTGFKGVYWDRYKNKYRAEITVFYKKKFLGYFANKEDAARAYNKGALEHHRDFARLNDV